jgi:cytoplasmic iron level regulating protein YaaA (DUF328/UPF0246 family)
VIIVLSPAKSLDLPRADGQGHTTPVFLEQAQALAHRMRGKTPADLERMMDISPDLARLNWQRFQDWTPNGRYGAGSLFDGDAYKTLLWDSLDADTQRHAQDRLRFLSGLYGLLRPFDRIEPYRLEMGRSLGPREPITGFWGTRIAKELNALGRETGQTTLLNLASEEYASSIDRNALDLAVITPVFKDRSKNSFKVISFHAKRARGAMARWALLTRPQTPEDLQGFQGLGYAWDRLSPTTSPVYLRAQPPQA